MSRLLREGRVFEYWAHEACLLPVEDFQLFRWRMRGRGHWDSHERALVDHPEVAEHVLSEIRERGPLGSRHFEGPSGGGMWNWKPAKRVLDSLWDRGDLSIAGRQSFQRLYDLTERVIPRAVLEAPEPSEAEAMRALVLRAVRARGALTESGIAEHYRLPGRTATVRPHVEALVGEGALRRLEVDDGGPRGPGAGRGAAARVRVARGHAAVPLRQPALGPALRPAGLRLRPRDGDLQARPAAGVRLLRPARAPG